MTELERDFKLVETGFSYWATTLNRIAARLALARIKQRLESPKGESAEEGRS